jgi:hypothetical protein
MSQLLWTDPWLASQYFIRLPSNKVDNLYKRFFKQLQEVLFKYACSQCAFTFVAALTSTRPGARGASHTHTVAQGALAASLPDVETGSVNI